MGKRALLSVVVGLLVSDGAFAAPPVQCPSMASVPSKAATADVPTIFGVSKRLPAMLSVRGGAVLEPESADDVQAIILKAASEQKLVVIDFTGEVLLFVLLSRG